MPLTVFELNPQAVPQYGFPRRNFATASGTIGLHTAENRPVGVGAGVDGVARFLLTREDFGSYHAVCDAESRLQLARYDAETWGIGSLNNWAIHIAAASTAAEWNGLPQQHREDIVDNLAAAAADAARWCFDELGIVVPARRLTLDEAEARRPGFIGHGDADPDGRPEPGADFDWQRFLTAYRAAMDAHGIEVPGAGERTAVERGRVASFLALFVDGDYAHRTITEQERALAATGHYRGAIEENQGRRAVAGPVLFKAYQSFLAQLGFYSGRIDGDFGKVSTKAEQRFLASLNLYRGSNDGDRGKMTIKALQGALNRVAVRVGANKALEPPTMVNPAVGRITSEYGPRKLLGNVFHSGIDIANATGTDILAAFDGTVVEVGANIEPGRSGNAISIRSDRGGATFYGHLSRILVAPGQHVVRGQHIGEMGATGNVTGPHLHFETWRTAGGSSHENPRITFRRFGVTPGVDNLPGM
ncbi:MAG: peptidoglycan DD-metalloendopeptidase family protein [Georgenia sp.]